jgi:S-adenosylmethionine:tRNA ribosyltransferase-isomerase
MDVDELDYPLPEELIAQHPPKERRAARLLVVDRDTGGLAHRSVAELPSLARPALWVVNDTRVIPARLFGRKPTGGRVELLLVERTSPPGEAERWLAMGRASKPIRPGVELILAARSEGAPADLSARVLEKRDDGTMAVELRAPGGVEAALEQVGRVPLPPYIRREDDATDRERYQTVYAQRPGSVAAPTAGLHFDEALLSELEAAGHRLATVTLHVGPGTFRPVTSDRLEDHAMHTERYEVSARTAAQIAEARREGRPVIAVGTTVVRTLESSVDGGEVRAGEGSTDLFIRPPFEFGAVDALLTNFHLPRSTLIALVMAFAGQETTRRAYAAAVEARYRFFSYGDAMLIRDAGVRP